MLKFAAAIAVSLLVSQAAVAADPTADAPVVDLRDAKPSAVKKKVAGLYPKGISLAYSGPEEKRVDIVREISRQSAHDGYPIVRVVLVAPSDDEAAVLLKPNGDAIGDPIKATADLHFETHARVAIFASDRAGAQCSNAPATGSIMRQKKVCNVAPPKPEAVRAADKAPLQTGGDATEPVPGN